MTASSSRSVLSGLLHFGRRYRTQLWIVLLTVCASIFFFQGRDDFTQAIGTLSQSSPNWIALIIIAQIAILALAAGTYQIVLRHTDNHLRLGRLFALHLERKVIGTILPGGGPASVYVFVRGLGRERVSSEDALFTIGVRSLLGFGSFISFLLPALLLAQPGGALLAGALVLIAGFILVVGLVLLFLRHPHATQGIERRIPERVGAMLGRVRNHRLGLSDLATPYLLALASQLASVITLAAALYALGYSPSIVSILAAYAVGTAAVTIAPAFQGIGLVEVSMAVTLQQFGVPPDVAIGATLLYRGGTVWFPLVLGALLHARQWVPSIEASQIAGWSQRRLSETIPVRYFSTGVMAAIVAVALVLVS